ncbi:hypothetical protein [Streptomyces coffeae]|uniref:Uncharacterized protein n=1 Tax=Streptomyces coffeae TaxID=621382 RepID=A0ABS1NJ22_9ACTN|nr:hypothetical protein [Streptomyces coffeae]MBL1100114.1 hypothetical protein [Streptomyces coffeae]
MLELIAFVALVVCITAPLMGSWAHARRPNRRRADRQLLTLARHTDRKANR